MLVFIIMLPTPNHKPDQIYLDFCLIFNKTELKKANVEELLQDKKHLSSFGFVPRVVGI